MKIRDRVFSLVVGGQQVSIDVEDGSIHVLDDAGQVKRQFPLQVAAGSVQGGFQGEEPENTDSSGIGEF